MTSQWNKRTNRLKLGKRTDVIPWSVEQKILNSSLPHICTCVWFSGNQVLQNIQYCFDGGRHILFRTIWRTLQAQNLYFTLASTIRHYNILCAWLQQFIWGKHTKQCCQSKDGWLYCFVNCNILPNWYIFY